LKRSPIHFLENILSTGRRGAVLAPLSVVYYLTLRCNLNCAYCEDFGYSRNPKNASYQPSTRVYPILGVLRQASDSLTFTGGETLLHPEILPILKYSRQVLKFRQLTLLTNGLLLSERASILPLLDRLVISLDSLDTQFWAGLIGQSEDQAKKIVENVIWAASKQKDDRFTLIINCVLNPHTLSGVDELVKFCSRHHILISFSPQSVQNWPDYDLLVSTEYKSTLLRLIEMKKKGAPILGSLPYLKSMADVSPYTCHPTLLPRVLPDGALIYPCRPIEREGSARGGQPVNLLDVQNWEEALRIASQAYGDPPETCSSCFQQCYAEPSLMQNHPLSYFWDWLRYPASRRGDLITYSPG
jgi:MoaA/NifB/PqqE/SkfB family radical SAM enzyme